MNAYILPMTYQDIYVMKYNEVYGNYHWVDKALDMMCPLYTEEDDDFTKNLETFNYFNKWDLKDPFIQNYTENQTYRKIDDDIENNVMNDLDISDNDDSLNEETFSNVSHFDFYNSFLNFKYICLDNYLEELCNVNSVDNEFDIRNKDTFGTDTFSAIYDIV